MAKNECPRCAGPVVLKKNTRGMVNFKCLGKGDNPNCKANGYSHHEKKEVAQPAKEAIKDVPKDGGNNSGVDAGNKGGGPGTKDTGGGGDNGPGRSDSDAGDFDF